MQKSSLSHLYYIISIPSHIQNETILRELIMIVLFLVQVQAPEEALEELAYLRK